MICKKCLNDNSVKNGFIRGYQRYKCKDCGCVYTDTKARGKPESMKALAIVLYTACNASLGMIGKLLEVSNVAVLKWVRKEARGLDKPAVSEHSKYIIIDEMWHFVDGKKTRFGSGKPMILYQGEWSPGNWVGVMLERSKNS